MSSNIARRPGSPCITQFSIFLDNKVGRLNELMGVLGRKDVHIMALCTVDNTDSAITRLIADYPDDARKVLKEAGFHFNEANILAIELASEGEIRHATSALAAAEINIHYIYPFVMRPGGASGLVIGLEDNDLGAEVMSSKGIKVLDQDDIAR